MMRIVVVNLERSTDRRETMRARLDALGLDYEFFPAVDGRAGAHLRFANYDDAFCLRAWRRPLTPGEVGCFASHYLLWQRCVAHDEPLLVMEDDVDMSPGLKDLMRLLPGLSGYGYVRLAGIANRRFRPVRTGLPGDRMLVRFLAGPMGTQGYALFPRGAARFLAGSGRWLLPVDTYMDSFWQHGVSCLGLMPFPISARGALVSTISPDGRSPSAMMRSRVWRPKRFLARNAAGLRRHWANLQYLGGMRKPGCAE